MCAHCKAHVKRRSELTCSAAACVRRVELKAGLGVAGLAGDAKHPGGAGRRVGQGVGHYVVLAIWCRAVRSLKVLGIEPHNRRLQPGATRSPLAVVGAHAVDVDGAPARAPVLFSILGSQALEPIVRALRRQRGAARSLGDSAAFNRAGSLHFDACQAGRPLACPHLEAVLHVGPLHVAPIAANGLSCTAVYAAAGFGVLDHKAIIGLAVDFLQVLRPASRHSQVIIHSLHTQLKRPRRSTRSCTGTCTQATAPVASHLGLT